MPIKHELLQSIAPVAQKVESIFHATDNLKNSILKTYDYIKRRGPKPFEYHINIEIKNELTPKTWLKKEL